MLPTHLSQALNHFATQHLLRKRRTLTEKKNPHIVIEGKKLINYCSNDYLNLSEHPAVKQACLKAIEKYGCGSGAAALVSGHQQLHQKLEETMAAFLQRERALLFNSGYHANLGVLTTFANRNSIIIADKYVHASLIDGMVLSRAAYHRYKHNDWQHAETLLQHYAGHETLLVCESVFSIHGNIAPIAKLAASAAANQALFIVDDAHGIGILGKTGAGICEHDQLSQHQIPLLITPFGKALGSMGAVVSGSHSHIEALLQFARTYRYSTALPPVVCAATLAILEILRKENWRRTRLQHLIQFFIHAAELRGLPLLSNAATPIKSIIIGNNRTVVALQEKLFHDHFFVSCIRSPTVRKYESCLRISLNCLHTEENILQLLDQISLHLQALSHE